MDQSLLVSNGHALLDALDKRGIKIRAAMWVHNPDVGSWKLWIVPPPNLKDKHEFYRIISEVISANRPDLTLDASDTEMIAETHPAIQALRSTFRVESRSSIHLSHNTFNGFYLPDGIILQMAF